MTKAKGHILPFFIPNLGCPHQCIFCDQQKIAGVSEPSSPDAIWAEIIAYNNKFGIKPELAFYGGSFGGINYELRQAYLAVAAKAFDKGMISGTRVSTRPDNITQEFIHVLKKHQVTTVELGVQSMISKALIVAERGQTPEQSIQAVKLLQGEGFRVGVQLMPGLPEESQAQSVEGAVEILSLRPDFLRIYPTVVIKNTKLADLYTKGMYTPLTLEEATETTLFIKLLAEHYGVKVIRMGLQPEAGLEEQVLAGPYHAAFGNLVESLFWRKWAVSLLDKYNQIDNGKILCFILGKENIPKLVGQNKMNVPFLAGLAMKTKLDNLVVDSNQLGVKLTGGLTYFVTQKDFTQELLAEVCQKFGLSLF